MMNFVHHHLQESRGHLARLGFMNKEMRHHCLLSSQLSSYKIDSRVGIVTGISHIGALASQLNSMEDGIIK